MGALWLVLGAVHLAVPPVGQRPGLVALHGDVRLMPRLPGTEGRHHVDVARHMLIGARVALVEGHLFGSGRHLVGWYAAACQARHVHVLLHREASQRGVRRRLESVLLQAHAV